jgi:prepilin-type N-terminal cleavage/methylation domain-containing protein
MKPNKGFSIIELVIAMLIIGIVAAVGASVVVFTIQDLIYTPAQLNMNMLAEEALGKIIDGDSSAAGLRFSRQITDASTSTSVTFIDQSGRTVQITLNTGTNKLSRTINSVTDANFLYYSSASNIALSAGSSGAFFTFYDASGSTTNTAANVRMVDIDLACRTSGGAFGNWQGSSQQRSAIKVSKLQ